MTDGPSASNTFNLFVREVETVGTRVQVKRSEVFRNLSMITTAPRYAVRVVDQESTLVSLADSGIGALPAAVTADQSGAPTAFQNVGSSSDGSLRDPNGNIDATTASAFATAIKGSEQQRTGIHALDGIEPFIFNLLCIPAAADLGTTNMDGVYTFAKAYCEPRRAFLIVDIPKSVVDKEKMVAHIQSSSWGATKSKNSAVYFPRTLVPDPLNEGRPRDIGASGTLAGVYARTDSTRGVWKAPARIEADLRGVELVTKLTDLENGTINPLGANALRNFPIRAGELGGTHYGRLRPGSQRMEVHSRAPHRAVPRREPLPGQQVGGL